MHHKPAPGSRICVMTSAGDNEIAPLSWLLNLGLVSERAEVFVPDRREVSRPIAVTTASLRSTPPDPPPPRA
jgi:hypothetical protein